MVEALGIHTGGGPYNHLRGFLQTLCSTDRRHDWTFVLNEAFNIEIQLPSTVHLQKVKIRNHGQRLFEDLVKQRISVERSGADVVLNLADFGPLPHGVPALSFQRNPNYYGVDLLQLRHGLDRVEWELRRHLAHRIVRRSNRVLCPSETMAEAVRSCVKVPSGRVGALYHPYEPPPSESAWSRSADKRILYTGHLMPHKNHRWLLEVFAESRLARNGVELCMTAARSDWPGGFDALNELAQKAGIVGQVHLLGRVPSEEMAALYKSASIFVFASAGESFGFSMVEALSAGIPVLAYDTPIAREILGSAAEFLPSRVDLAGQKLREIVNRGDDWLEQLSQRSLQRAREVCLSWTDWLTRLEAELERVASAGI